MGKTKDPVSLQKYFLYALKSMKNTMQWNLKLLYKLETHHANAQVIFLARWIFRQWATHIVM